LKKKRRGGGSPGAGFLVDHVDRVLVRGRGGGRGALKEREKKGERKVGNLQKKKNKKRPILFCCRGFTGRDAWNSEKKKKRKRSWILKSPHSQRRRQIRSFEQRLLVIPKKKRREIRTIEKKKGRKEKSRRRDFGVWAAGLCVSLKRKIRRGEKGMKRRVPSPGRTKRKGKVPEFVVPFKPEIGKERIAEGKGEKGKEKKTLPHDQQ